MALGSGTPAWASRLPCVGTEGQELSPALTRVAEVLSNASESCGL